MGDLEANLGKVRTEGLSELGEAKRGSPRLIPWRLAILPLCRPNQRHGRICQLAAPLALTGSMVGLCWATVLPAMHLGRSQGRSASQTEVRRHAPTPVPQGRQTRGGFCFAGPRGVLAVRVRYQAAAVMGSGQ